MRRALSILDATRDPMLFGPWFRKPETWAAWFSFLAALFGLPMTPEQAAIYRQCTGRKQLDRRISDEGIQITPASEAYLVIGRRGGKSFVLSLIAVWMACFHDWRKHLAPGERATIPIICVDRRQARVVMRYVRSLLLEVPMLARLLERETAESFDLRNRTTIEIHAASFRRTRGYACPVCILDEAAFFMTDDSNANPDRLILEALRPSQVQFPNSLMLVASSPYSRRGILFDAWKRHYGQDGDVLVWKAPTRVMNPSVKQSIIDAAMERDPSAAAAEFMAEFRSDLESYISLEAVEAVVSAGCRERAPQAGQSYVCGIDPSGGASDSFCLAIAHREKDQTILDCLRETRPPFSPENVCEQYAETMKSYRCSRATSDKYAGLWPVEQFAKYGIKVEQSADPKSVLYQALLPLINSRKVALLDHPRLVAQLVNLERRTSRVGKDAIAEPPGSHDDVANAAALAISLAAVPRFDSSYSWIGDLHSAEAQASWRDSQYFLHIRGTI